MTEIINLADHRPHLGGPVICTRCEHEWVAARPVDADVLECPKCRAKAGMSLDTLLAKPKEFFGHECCGQVDCDGVCVAPACAYGDQLKYAAMVRRMVEVEFGVTIGEFNGS